MKKIQLVTDGSCIGNPGYGGWACILLCGDSERELKGSEARTTNNRMELTAVINGLRAQREQCEVELITDSQYVKQGMTEYLPRWRTNGWRTSGGKPVQNQELWQELDDLVQQHVIHWVWVAGHADHAVQNRCDALALAAARGEAVTLRCNASRRKNEHRDEDVSLP